MILELGGVSSGPWCCKETTLVEREIYGFIGSNCTACPEFAWYYEIAMLVELQGMCDIQSGYLM